MNTISPTKILQSTTPATAWPQALNNKPKLAAAEEEAETLAVLQKFSAGTNTRNSLAVEVIARQMFGIFQNSNMGREPSPEVINTAAALFVAKYQYATVHSCVCYFAEYAAGEHKQSLASFDPQDIIAQYGRQFVKEWARLVENNRPEQAQAVQNVNRADALRQMVRKRLAAGETMWNGDTKAAASRGTIGAGIAAYDPSLLRELQAYADEWERDQQAGGAF